jgi:hypothetical protein
MDQSLNRHNSERRIEIPNSPDNIGLRTTLVSFSQRGCVVDKTLFARFLGPNQDSRGGRIELDVFPLPQFSIGQFAAFTIRADRSWRACCHPAAARSEKLPDFVRNIGADA